MLGRLLAGGPELAALPAWEDFRRQLLQERLRLPSKQPPLLFAGALLLERAPGACAPRLQAAVRGQPAAAALRSAAGQPSTQPSRRYCLPLAPGQMIDTQEAALYRLVRGGQVAGLLVSSESVGAAGD